MDAAGSTQLREQGCVCEASATAGSLARRRAAETLEYDFYEDYLKLACEKADILVTHEACSAHPNGFEAIDELARALGVQKAFHGHHHDTLDYRCAWPRLGFEAYGIGFCGVINDQGQVLRAGDFDAQRQFRQQQVRCA